MGDDESRREDARIEAQIEKGLCNGTLAECPYCYDIRDTKEMEEIYEETEEVMCRRCRVRREEG